MVVCVPSKRSVCFCQRRGTAILGNILPSLRKYSAQFEAASVYFHCGSLRALDTRPAWSQDVWKKDICSIQTATGISRCKIYSCFYLGDQKQVRIRLQPRFGLFAKSLMKPYSFVGPGLMHFCSPRTHLLSKAPPTQTPPAPLPTFTIKLQTRQQGVSWGNVCNMSDLRRLCKVVQRNCEELQQSDKVDFIIGCIILFIWTLVKMPK